MPGPFVDQADALPGDGGQGTFDVVDAVADVVDTLAVAGEELPDRGVIPDRLEQLHV